ncbi:MAG: hypothetical protein M1838_005423 [Thelocarpon superellum]|nr:MAG: hypothetical protein M1838_005423 [Thelocarpon superellum]
MNSDNGIDHTSILDLGLRPKPAIPSNVTRICRALLPESRDGVPQIIYYQAGVGSSSNVRDRIVGGTTGLGLSENIREAYDFLANNYVRGDDIFLLGFSRGAFTARSIASLMATVGILTRAGMDDFYAIFQDFERGADPHYDSPFPDVPFRNKPNINNPEYKWELRRLGLTTVDIQIKVVGVWDTVGSLGIPRLGWFDKIDWPMPDREYSFDNTVVDECVENAFQALALDEERGPFSPSVWQKRRGSPTYLKQVWFPGVHSNVGGGYEDAEIANITLAWMISLLEPFLDFNNSYFVRQINLNREYYIDQGEKVRPWSFGEIYDSMTGIYNLTKAEPRTPGEYSIAGRKPDHAVYVTNEYIHASVRARIGLKGPGIEDKGAYNPPSLRGWHNVIRRVEVDGELQREVLWEQSGGHHDRTGVVLPEDTLGPLEIELLSASPDVRDRIVGAGRH